MKYALNLAEDGRILSVTEEEFAAPENVIVDTFPEGDVYEYRYVDGEYIHEPLPAKEFVPTAHRNITAGEYVTINNVLYLATENIPNGEPIIVGQNAIKTTVEEQLYELKGE